MPLIKSAIKKMHQDRARTKINQGKKLMLKKTLKTTRASVSLESLSQAYSALDRAAKNGLIHKNKAARQKAQLAKLAAGGEKTVKKVVSKKTTKAKAKSK